ncbi:MAG TPA: hypothetical protein VNU68_05065 [Verrucomicrobiae bacterium]|nr:hypothetical protein [Verrucomicrobiae bacterium]
MALLFLFAFSPATLIAATYSSDFNSGTPAGMTLFGAANVSGGFLQLTPALNGQFGIAYIDDFGGGQLVQSFRATFKAALFGSTCCGGLPADGFSFNLVPAASALPNPGYGQPAEEGLNEGLAVNFDTWDNGGGEAPAIEVKWKGTTIATAPFQASQSPVGAPDAASALREVDINLEPDGTLDVSYGGTVVLSNVQTPYRPQVVGIPKWVFGARTGSANDNHFIDDLRIVAVPAPGGAFCSDFNSGQPAGTSLFGAATVSGGYLQLTPALSGQFGITYIDDFSGGQPVQAFRATFKAALFGSTCCGGGALPADGFSFNLVPAVSVLPSPGIDQPGEEGLGSGLAVNFDTWDNGAAEAPAIEVKWMGTIIASTPFQASQSPVGAPDAATASRDVEISLDPDGTIDVSYGGTLVLNNVPTPYNPTLIGAPKWVLGARTGGANDNHWIDDLCIVALTGTTFCSDFNSGPPARTTLFGAANVSGGFLQLTPALNDQFGIVYIDDFGGGQSVQSFRATFKAALFGSTCCGGGTLPADGFSFNLVPAATVLANPGYGQPAEEGLNEGLAVNFDTWDNGAGEAPAIEVKWLGTIIATTPFQPSQSPIGAPNAAAALRDVDINLEPDGTIDVSYGGTPVLSNVQTPYRAGVIGVPKWVFGARTGAANDSHAIDDLCIVATPPAQAALCLDFDGGQPAGTSLFGAANVSAGFLQLTPALNDQFGIAYVDDFGGGCLVQSFHATFKAALFGSTCCGGGAMPADGFSFNLVPAISVLPNPGYGQPAEEGLNEGLAINFDTWDNGGGEAPAIEVKWMGTIIATTPFQPSQSPVGAPDAATALRDVQINLDLDGTIDVSYGGTLVLNNVPTPYNAALIGAPKWVLGARTGGANDNHWIDDLCIFTTITPASQPRLQITLVAPGQLQICWPFAAAGYVLQSTTSLQPPINWTAVGVQPGLNAGMACLSLPITGPSFYRLIKN